MLGVASLRLELPNPKSENKPQTLVRSMENLKNNPSLSIDIGQKILHYLDDTSLQTCRLVDKSMKHMVDEPRFWIQKLEKKGLNPQFKSKTLNKNGFVQENLLNWRKLVDLVEKIELEKNATLCLIKMYQNFPTNPENQVPINFTAYVGDASLVELIIGQIDLTVKTTSMKNDDFLSTKAFDCTPVWIAAYGGHTNVVKLLMNVARNPNQPRNDGVTPIFIAAQKNHIQVVKLLISSTDNPNQARNGGCTPIFIAAQYNHIDMVKLLMNSTENPNRPNNNGATPIFIAAQNNHIEVVKLLINSTENPNEPKNDGTTPLTIAAKNDHFEMVQSLLDGILAANRRITPMEIE